MGRGIREGDSANPFPFSMIDMNYYWYDLQFLRRNNKERAFTEKIKNV